jgi:hypothetical protein
MSDQDSNPNETQESTATATAALAVENADKYHDIRELKFGFRKQKDADTGVETKRPTIEVKLPVLSFEGIVQVLQNGGKGLELLHQAVENVYTDFIKEQLAADAKIDATNFPFDQFTWDAIANQPESERRGRGIPKEVWEDFLKDYITVMPAATGKTDKQIEKQAAVLAQKLQPLKNHEDKEKLLPSFKDMLTVYLNTSKEAETYTECVDFLMKKADSLLNAEKESNLAANLGF